MTNDDKRKVEELLYENVGNVITDTLIFEVLLRLGEEATNEGITTTQGNTSPAAGYRQDSNAEEPRVGEIRRPGKPQINL